MLEVINLECTRGDRALISGMSFSLAEGELLHVIGSNGSGKTTLLRTLCGLSRRLMTPIPVTATRRAAIPVKRLPFDL